MKYRVRSCVFIAGVLFAFSGLNGTVYAKRRSRTHGETHAVSPKSTETPPPSKHRQSEEINTDSSSIPMIKQQIPPPGRVFITPFLGTSFVDYGYGLSLGIRVIGHGFISSINNSIALDFKYYYHQTVLNLFGIRHHIQYFGGGPRWEFHVARPFTAFAGFDVGLSKSSYTDIFTNEPRSDDKFDFGFVLGALWHFSRFAGLRLDHSTFTGSTNLGVTLIL